MDQEKEKMDCHEDEVTANESTMMELDESDNESLSTRLDSMAKRIKLTHKVEDSDRADIQNSASTDEMYRQNDGSTFPIDLSGYSEFAVLLSFYIYSYSSNLFFFI